MDALTTMTNLPPNAVVSWKVRRAATVLGIRLVRNQRTLVGTVACALRLGAPVVTVAVSKNAQTYGAIL